MVETDQKSEGSPSLTVVRDSTFCRAVADQIMLLPLGRDVELACLQSGPLVQSARDTDGAAELSLQPVRTEVVRLRIAYSGAVNLAMNILRFGIEADLIDVEKLKETIDQWVPHDGSLDDE